MEKPDISLNIFYEWDGYYVFEGKDKNVINFSIDFILSLSNEIEFKANKNNSSEII